MTLLDNLTSKGVLTMFRLLLILGLVATVVGVSFVGVSFSQERGKGKPVIDQGDDEVPVVQKNKGFDKNNIPVAQGDKSDAGLMPTQFIKNRVENLKAGSAGYVDFSAVKVDANKKVYVEPNYVFHANKSANQVTIMRDQGGYHLFLQNVEHEWDAKELPANSKLIPVRTVTVK
jgi:hypothetical protein